MTSVHETPQRPQGDRRPENPVPQYQPARVRADVEWPDPSPLDQWWKKVMTLDHRDV
ncbi:hypothetical protein DFR67_10695 [Williamsia limnetica]|uniref:Uncharacterized protein n=1 Tax=Williamsia limnetica TaxID=882452 RepID=A0A318RIN7_WILLI|nr:hypothetical protein [Williamsia limnetica]PYE17392.1 hypothetical protein DFR67_10695 [Williamsia limnetica]